MSTDGRTSTGRRYLWLALLPLIMTVIASVALVIRANQAEPFDLLPGGELKTGKVVTGDSQAQLRFSDLSIQLQDAQVVLTGRKPIDADALQLHLLHATRSKLDATVLLRRTADQFRGDAPDEMPAHGTLVLTTAGAGTLVHAPYYRDGSLLILRFRPGRL